MDTRPAMEVTGLDASTIRRRAAYREAHPYTPEDRVTNVCNRAAGDVSTGEIVLALEEDGFTIDLDCVVYDDDTPFLAEWGDYPVIVVPYRTQAGSPTRWKAQSATDAEE